MANSRRRDKTWDEWRQENQKSLSKIPSGGVMSPISPAYGSSGAIRRSPPGSQGGPTSGFTGPSKYNVDPRSQPQSWIDDVDENANWFSPMQPVWPFGPPYVNNPREFDYPTGYNINFIPNRMNLFGMLRAMRSSWGVLAAVIATKQDQLLRVPWTIQGREKARQDSVSIREMKDFFKKPDGKRRYSQWANLILDDLLVLDAPAIYFPKRRDGKPLFAERIDGATIFPLMDDAGRRPDSIIREVSDDGTVYLQRQPAFQQIIKGMPMIDLDETELMYEPMRPRAEMPMFGYSPIEQILVETTEAIRKTFYQLNFWTEGTIPDLIVTVPKEWTPRQIAMFQAHFDAMLSGNLPLKSKVRFLPGDMKPFDIKNSSGESLWSDRDEHLIRLVCFAYGESPAPFVQMMNRSTAQNAQQVSVEEGLFPLMSYWKDVIMDPIIQDKFGYDDAEFIFQPIPEPNGEKQSKIHQVQVDNGIRTRNEVRISDLGLEPVEGGDVPTVTIGNAVIPLKDAAEGKALPNVGGDPESGGSSANGPKGSTQPQPTNTPVRGASRPRSDSPTPSNKIAELINLVQEVEDLYKVTAAEIDSAASNADGDVNSHSSRRLEAGNYRKGHLKLHGLDISIENRAFSTRGKRNNDGSVRWSARMPGAHYGYIRGTVGADGDHVDCYIGRRPESDTVFIIDQTRLSKKGKIKFDEHKVMLGYKSLRKALRDYGTTRDDGLQRVGGVVELSVDDFKEWLSKGDTTKPACGNCGTIVRENQKSRERLSKGDTIGASTGLVNNYPKPKKKKKKRRTSGPRWLELTAAV